MRLDNICRIRLLILLILIVFVSGCMQNPDPDSLGMAVEFNDHAACAYVAEEMGWYEEEGINLTAYESYATGMQLTSAIARGDIRIAYICLAPAILAYSSGVPVTIVAGTHKHGYGLVAGSEITNISQLSGVTVGCPREGSMVDILLRCLIRQYDLKDVRIKRMEPLKQVIALETGSIDAAFLPEHHATVAESKGFQMLITSQELWPELQGSVLIVKNDLIENDPDTVRKLICVTQNATTWINNNPDDAAGILAKELDTDPAIIRRSMSRLNYTTTIDEESVQDMIDHMVEFGLIEEGIRAEDILDTEFLLN
jgi:NitT/TauT family transport system substrate-binding protein